MTKRHGAVLVAFVDGSDLDDVVGTLRPVLQELAAETGWRSPDEQFIEHRETESDDPEYLPDWSLGMSLSLEHIATEPAWRDDIATLFETLKRLAGETDRVFYTAVCYQEPHWLENTVAFVDGKSTVEFDDLFARIESYAQPIS